MQFAHDPVRVLPTPSRASKEIVVYMLTAWLLLAAAQGDENKKKAVTMLETRMSQEQIAEGQKLALNFKPHKALDSGRGVAH